MGTKYSTVSISGYNSGPPADDGTQTAANQVKWSTIKTKLPDPLKTAIEAINTQLVTYSDFGIRQVSTSDSTTAADYMKTVEIAPGVSTSVTVSLGDAATMAAGYIVTVKNSSAINQTVGRATAGNTINGFAGDIVLPAKEAATFKVIGAQTGYIIESTTGGTVYDSTDPRKAIAIKAPNVSSGATREWDAPNYNIRLGNLPAGIGPLPYAGATVPTGWLECDGSAVSRSTYAALYTAIGDTWGAGNGTTTFNLPNMCGRTAIGAGTGSATETVTDAAITTGTDSITVASNATKWVTGMQVSWGVTGTPPTTNPANLLDNNDVVFVVRIDATTIKLATTLANAQNGTVIDITAAGSGTFVLTHGYTARTLGQYGGEEAHAMSISELVSHRHFLPRDPDEYSSAAGGTDGGKGAANYDTYLTDYAGGNAAMNIMSPFAVVKYIISY